MIVDNNPTGNDHYDNAKVGTWTYFDTGHESNFLFRKGTPSDPICNPRGHDNQPCAEVGGRSDKRDPRQHDWIIGISEWVIPVDPMMELVCDLLNDWESKLNTLDSWDALRNAPTNTNTTTDTTENKDS